MSNSPAEKYRSFLQWFLGVGLFLSVLAKIIILGDQHAVNAEFKEKLRIENEKAENERVKYEQDPKVQEERRQYDEFHNTAPVVAARKFLGLLRAGDFAGAAGICTGPNTNRALSERELSKLVKDHPQIREAGALEVKLTKHFIPLYNEFLELNQPEGSSLKGRDEVVQLEPGSTTENSPDELMITASDPDKVWKIKDVVIRSVAAQPMAPALPPKAAVDPLARWTKEAPYINSLGMEFVPAGTRAVLFCKWDTRVSDYREFVTATNRDMSGGMSVLKVKGADSLDWELDAAANWKNPGFQQSDAHPVVGVSLEDGQAFCEWLTEKERKAGLLPPGATYRLPRDEEWSAAVGQGKYPWGDSWPPPPGSGNYGDKKYLKSLPGDQTSGLRDYDDGYPRTSPVGKFAANRFGLYDMGGNVWQWCDNEYRPSMNSPEAIEEIPISKDEKASHEPRRRLLRGASWSDNDEIGLRSAYRLRDRTAPRSDDGGFRCVLVVSGG